jgi:phage-related protein
MTDTVPRKIPVVFYRTRGGAEVVRDWLRSLEERDRNAVGLDLMRVQFRWPVGMPLCRPMGDGLWELRTSLPSRRIARVLFCLAHDHIVVLHGFIKKTQKTPDEELALARKRKREFDDQG